MKREKHELVYKQLEMSNVTNHLSKNRMVGDRGFFVCLFVYFICIRGTRHMPFRSHSGVSLLASQGIITLKTRDYQKKKNLW